MTRFVQPEKIEIDANERAVNEKSQYCFFVCTTFDSFLNDFTEISIVFKNTNNESNDIELEYLPKIEWPKHDIIWNLYLYDGRSLQQFSKLDDI